MKQFFKQITVGITTGIILTGMFVPQAEATKIAGPSATLATPSATTVVVDDRAEILKTYLKAKNSPLAPEASFIIEEADRYKIDWRLVPAIAGNESGFGLAIPPGSYNAWGFGVYGTHVTYFNSWKDGIHQVSQSLSDDYRGRWGATDVYSIGRIYAADSAWAVKVSNYMTEISTLQDQMEEPTLSISF